MMFFLCTDFPLIVNQTDEVSGSTDEVTWEQSSCPFVMHVVYYREVTRAGGSGWSTVNASRGATHYNLQLECFKEYEIAVTNRNTSLPSKLWKVKTGTGKLSLERPAWANVVLLSRSTDNYIYLMLPLIILTSVLILWQTWTRQKRSRKQLNETLI